MYLLMGQPTRAIMHPINMYHPMGPQPVQSSNKHVSSDKHIITSTISQPPVHQCVRAGPLPLPRHVVGVDTAKPLRTYYVRQYHR